MRAVGIALSVAALGIGIGAATASAQALPETTNPTGPHQVRIVEPPDEAIIPGASIRIVIEREPAADEAVGGEPNVFVFLDGALQSSLLPAETRLTLEGVSPARHRVSVLAIDHDNQVVDRQDVSVQTVEVAAGSIAGSAGGKGFWPDHWNSADAALAAIATLVLVAIGGMLLPARPRPRRPGRLGRSAAGRILLVALGLAAAVSVTGQTEDLPARRSAVVPARAATLPDPTDPTGVYTGVVSVTIEDFPAVLQVWRIDIQARPCPECVTGQYFLSGTNFAGITFDGGFVERGSVRGSVNPGGESIDLALATVNCPFISPSGSDRNYGGRTWGGSFGEVPGTPLVVSNGSMTGRISGRDCYGRLVTANVSLQRQSLSVPPPCNSVQGIYTAAYVNSMGSNGGGAATIVQDGCFFVARLPGINAEMEGVMNGPTSAEIHVRDDCSATYYDGTLTVNGNTLLGTYSGPAGAASACPSGNVSGTFTLTHS